MGILVVKSLEEEWYLRDDGHMKCWLYLIRDKMEFFPVDRLKPIEGELPRSWMMIQ